MDGLLGSNCSIRVILNGSISDWTNENISLVYGGICGVGDSI